MPFFVGTFLNYPTIWYIHHIFANKQNRSQISISYLGATEPNAKSQAGERMAVTNLRGRRRRKICHLYSLPQLADSFLHFRIVETVKSRIQASDKYDGRSLRNSYPY